MLCVFQVNDVLCVFQVNDVLCVFQVNGHQMMDEPMEEESYTHCVHTHSLSESLHDSSDWRAGFFNAYPRHKCL